MNQDAGQLNLTGIPNKVLKFGKPAFGEVHPQEQIEDLCEIFSKARMLLTRHL